RLKQQPGHDIVIHGSPTLIRSLLPHNLIDEYRLLVYPIVLGRGKRLFDEASQAKLKLAESETFSKGVVKLVYRRDDEAKGAAKAGAPARKRETNGPTTQKPLAVSLQILDQDFHRARHVLAFKEKNRIRVRRHLFHDVDAPGGERP